MRGFQGNIGEAGIDFGPFRGLETDICKLPDLFIRRLRERLERDCSTSVSYRGAKWRAALVPGESPQTGPHRIESTDGNSLLIKKI